MNRFIAHFLCDAAGYLLEISCHGGEMKDVQQTDSHIDSLKLMFPSRGGNPQVNFNKSVQMAL